MHNLLILLVYIIIWYLLSKLLKLSVKRKRFTFNLNPTKGAKHLETYLLLDASEQALVEIPQYKFYSFLIEELFSYRNRFGIPIEKIIYDLRVSLVRDKRETQKVMDLLWGGIFQCLFMLLFLIGFYVSSRIILELIVEPSKLLGISLWIFFSLLSFVILISRLMHKTFFHFSSYIKAIYKFKILLQISKPINEVIDLSQINSLPAVQELDYIQTRIQMIIKKIRNKGGVEISVWDFLIKELWDYFELKVLSFSKTMKTLQLLLIVVSLLPCFFYIIYQLFIELKL